MASPKVDLYNNAYGNYQRDVYRDVRIETYGEDFGQTSWVTTKESHEIPQLLGLTASSSVLELGCRSGRYALHLAIACGCRVVGLDLNDEGIRNANALAQANKLNSHCRFEHVADDTFDAAFANDVLCHIPGRAQPCFRNAIAS